MTTSRTPRRLRTYVAAASRRIRRRGGASGPASGDKGAPAAARLESIPGERPWQHKWNVLEVAIAFSVANNIAGDYLEFGVYRGGSFIHAYRHHRQLFERYTTVHRRHADDAFLQSRMRFLAFDSFEGLPASDQTQIPIHWRGDAAMACSEPEFLANLEAAGVDLADVVTVPGYFEASLTPDTARQVGLTRAAVVNVDCDLGASTVPVLDFLDDVLVDGTVLIFDDWFYYRGHPGRGEHGAFETWLARHPELVASELARLYPTVAFILNQREPA
jgi:O-methyltransferase